MQKISRRILLTSLMMTLGLAIGVRTAGAQEGCSKRYTAMNGDCPTACAGDKCPCTYCKIVIAY